TVFRITPAGTFTLLHAFSNSPDGSYLRGALVEASDGNFYGTTYYGGMGYGTVFRVTPDGATTIVHAFTGGANGANPAAALIQGPDGNFYGTTDSGGSAVCQC